MHNGVKYRHFELLFFYYITRDDLFLAVFSDSAFEKVFLLEALLCEDYNSRFNHKCDILLTNGADQLFVK